MKHLTGLCLFLSIATTVFLFPLSAFYFELLGLNQVVLPVLQGLESADTLKHVFVDAIGFQANEVSHFADVRALIEKGQFMLVVLCIFLSGQMLYRPHHIKECLKYPLYYAGGLMVLLSSIWLILGWKKLTAILHTIAFPSGNWRFPSDSLTIQLYGTKLMQMGMLTTILLLVIISTGLFMLERKFAQKAKDSIAR